MGRTLLLDLLEGLRFIAGRRTIVLLTVSMVMTVFAASFLDALGAIYVRDILSGSSGTFGILVSLVGIGTIFAAGLVGRLGQRRSKLELLALGILSLGTSTVVLGALTKVSLVMCCFLTFGLGVACILVSAQTLLQQEAPMQMLGRASSAIHSLITMAQLTAFLAAGAVAGWIGIRAVFRLVGAALLLIGCVVGVHTRRVGGTARADAA